MIVRPVRPALVLLALLLGAGTTRAAARAVPSPEMASATRVATPAGRQVDRPEQVQTRQAEARAGGRVTGIVIDARTGQPLTRVRVSLQASDDAAPVETMTGADGRFALEAPPGRATLTISAIGYSLARQAILISPSHSPSSPSGTPIPTRADLTIALSEGTGVYSEQVQVMGEAFPRRDPGVPSEQTLGSGDLHNLKSLVADDPLRALQALPGVSATDDLRAEFSIRGSDFRHIGVALDGVPSPLLVHTVHGVRDTGSLGMINSDILESVTVSAGSYPQRYGDRTGAFVDFRTRDGARDRVHARASISAVNASGVVEGPIGRSARGSWLISGRQSYADWIVRRIDPDITGTFRFTDAQGKVSYALTPRHQLQLNFVAGRSRFDESGRFGVYSLDIGTNRAGIASVSLRSTTSPAQTITQRVYLVSGRYDNLNPLGWDLGGGSSRDLSYRIDGSRLLSPRLLLEAGGHLQWQRASGYDTLFDRSGIVLRRPFDATATRQSAYGMVRWEVTPRLSIAPGGRVDRWSHTGETLASPWLQVDWRLPRAWTISGGGGLYRQAPELEEQFGPRGTGDLRAARAWQEDVGVGQRLGAYRWQATVFRRDERDLPALPASEPRLSSRGLYLAPSYTTAFDNGLRMASHGVELSVYRRAANGLSGWLGYAYAKTDAFDVLRNERYPSDVDQRHTLNAYARYRLSDRLSVSGRFRVGSNTPIPGYLSPYGDLFYLTDRRNLARLPTYQRLDVRADRTLAVGRTRLTLYLEALNVYNRRNQRPLTPLVYAPTLPVDGATEKLFPIIPSLGVTFEF